MGLTDPVVLVCQPAHELPYYLKRGTETFYDEERYHRRWRTMEEAVLWCKQNLGVTPYDHLPEAAKQRALEEQGEWERDHEVDWQPRLL